MRNTRPKTNTYKILPVNGVTVGGRSNEASDKTSSTLGTGLVATLYSSSNMSKKISSPEKVKRVIEYFYDLIFNPRLFNLELLNPNLKMVEKSGQFLAIFLKVLF